MRLNFKELNEPGVRDISTEYIFTPLPTAKQLYFYITQIGHYFCTRKYAIKRDYFYPMLALCVKRGCLNVQYRSASYKVMPGDGILIDCQEPHYYYADMDGLEFFFVHFDGSNIHDICKYLLDTKGPLIDRENVEPLSNFIKNTIDFYEGGNTETEFQESRRIYEILKYLHGGSAQDARGASYIDEVSKYVSDNIGERISLDELSEVAALSSFHFSRRFKRDTGYSPIEYVNNRKLDYGKTLLIRTDLSISEIAEKTGFSLKGFIKLFSHAEGKSPASWRKERQQHVQRV